MNLNQTHYKILNYIKTLQQRGQTPSIREIADHVGHKSTSQTHHYLAVMEAAGVIKREPNKARCIEVLEQEVEHGP